MSVAFVDFWSGFDPHAFFIPLLSVSPFNFEVRVVNEIDADLVFHSVFQPRSKRIAARARRRLRRFVATETSTAYGSAPETVTGPIRIWYTGENIRPPLGEWDATLSFDPDCDLSRNAFFPLWWQLFPELIGDGGSAKPGIIRISRPFPLATFLSYRQGEAGNRTKFATAIISNPEATRIRAIEALRQLGPVDVFGRTTGRPVKDKYEVFCNYQFALCFENDAYPGYVTEKIFDAWSAGCIPIWWGLDQGSHLNHSAFVNLAEVAGLEELVAEVERLRRDRDALDSMSSLPLLVKPPSLDRVRALLGRALLDV